MHNSLAWIEWLDRIDRVLRCARRDLAAYAASASPRRLEAIERSRRQLAALTDQLRLLDRDVIATSPVAPTTDFTAHLRTALDTALQRLADLSGVAEAAAAERERLPGLIDAALREVRYQISSLIEPPRRRA